MPRHGGGTGSGLGCLHRGTSARRLLWEVGDPRNRNSAVSSVYMDGS